MTTKFFQNLSVKAGIGFWSLSQRTNLQNLFLFLVLLFLPTQLGLHFWPEFSYIQGIRIDYLSPTIYFTDILISILFLLFLTRDNLRKLFDFFTTAFRRPVFNLFIVLIFLGVVFSVNVAAGIYGVFKILELSFLTLTIAKNIQKYRFSYILAPLIVGILFESVISILQFQNEGSLGGILYFLGERAYNGLTPNIANASIGGTLILRPYGTFSHPNVLAGYLVLSMTTITLFKKYIGDYIYYPTIFLGTVCLMLAMGRVAILVWIGILFFILLKKLKGVIFAATAVVVSLVLFPGLYLRFSGILTSESLNERLNLMENSFEMIKHNPAVGVGLNNFLNISPFYQKINLQIPFLQPVHNIFLLLASEIGILAFFIVCYYLIRLFRVTTYKSRVLLVTLFVLGFFDHYFLTLQQGQMLLALVIGISLISRKNENAKI